MGFLHPHQKPSEADQLLSEQIHQNQAELEAKRQSLYQTRLDIIKGQGAENWTPDYTSHATPPAGGGLAGLPPQFGNIVSEVQTMLGKH